ncbi:MAG: OsmC family protein [Nitrososphaeria archaeon]
MLKTIVVDWHGKLRFSGKNEKGLSVNFDVPVEKGGDGTAMTPMETLLACLGACTGIDIVLIMKKKRQNLHGLTIEVTGNRRDEDPAIYTEIGIKYIVRGKSLSKEVVERSIQLSEEKYCSVSGMLRNSAKITTSYEIVEL